MPFAPRLFPTDSRLAAILAAQQQSNALNE